MAEHLGDLPPERVLNVLHKHLVAALKELDCAGSIADHYNLYRAVQDEAEKARRALRRSAVRT